MHDLIRGMATLGHHHVDDSLRNTFAEASMTTRVIAELFATRFDKQLVAGVAPEPGSALAAHVTRLASGGERRKLAEMLQHSVSETHSRRTRMSATIPSGPRRRRGPGGFDRPTAPGERAVSRGYGCCCPTVPGRCTGPTVAT